MFMRDAHGTRELCIIDVRIPLDRRQELMIRAARRQRNRGVAESVVELLRGLA
jgi:hypothetical protein